MSIFDYKPEDVLGTVESVDTTTVVMRVESDDRLRGLQVNHLIAVQSTKTNQRLIGLVSKIIRKSAFTDVDTDADYCQTFNIIKVILIGTHFDRVGDKDNVFQRTLSTVPTINAECFLINGERLKQFMHAISSVPDDDDTVPLKIGHYSIDEVL